MAVAVLVFALALVCGNLGAADLQPPVLKLTGDWQVQVGLSANAAGGKLQTVQLHVDPPALVRVQGEKYAEIPLFNPKTAGWVKGAKLKGLVAQECSARGLLDPASLQLRSGPQPGDPLFEINKDYAADLDWATFGRLAEGRIGEHQAVYADYSYTPCRIDSIVITQDGRCELRRGEPHVAMPVPPVTNPAERRVANIFLPGKMEKLGPDNLFPISETVYPEPPKTSPSIAEQCVPKAVQKLREGGTLRVLAWGDSVTAAGYLPDNEHDRWQAQFVARLRERFPRAKIELITEAWGGRNTASYLAEPPGSEHNYQEKVLAAKPDLVVSEFVNDAGLTPAQVETRYTKLQNDFANIGAEWIILTPHYVRPDWMGLTSQRDIDKDTRAYVDGLRQFAARHHIALADASLRYGRLWRQGIPYATLMSNGINHPNPQGMKLFTDSLMALFP